MLRLFVSMFLVAFVSLAESASRPLAGDCPTYQSVSNLNLTKMAGHWYAYATDSELFDPAFNCHRFGGNQNANGTISFEISQMKNGEDRETLVNGLLKPDAKTFLFWYDTVGVDEDTSGKQSKKIEAGAGIVYATDDVMVFFSCHQTKSFKLKIPHRNYYILVRDRTFDSFSKFKLALERLIELGVDLNELRFIENVIGSCKN